MKRNSTHVAAIAAFTLAIALAGSAAAQGGMSAGSHMDHSALGNMKGDGQSSMPAVDGEVRRIDKAAGKVTLRHGEIKQLEMPPMTMVYEVSDKTMLDTIKPGDKVKFKAINEKGKMIVTEMKPTN